MNKIFALLALLTTVSALASAPVRLGGTRGVPGIYLNALFIGQSNSTAYSSTSVQTPATAASTQAVYVVCTTACFVKNATSPTAVVGASMYLPAGVPAYIGVTPGDKIAVIRSTADGSLYYTEGN